ncbi:MAG: tRNA 2-thiocytidine biosynthesis TtcA family protein [Oscillospiraceae bacterium]|nr:tRNA 2-thiocytidine biosynthesis TtcA family protein [Oscillospiraceae bacterium]
MADALERLLSPFRAAVERYEMIKPGDRIAVGLSGGKDSVALLVLLQRLQRFYPASFELTAITLDPCFGGIEHDYTSVTRLCNQIGVLHIIKRTRLGEIIFEERRENNPCSLCARMRRGALHKTAQEAGCNVVALGHHKDDAAQTLLMNLFAGGRISCFSPVSELTQRQLRIIRPLVFIEEKEIGSAVVRCGLPVVKSRCPADGKTHRQEMNDLIAELSNKYGGLSERIIGAMQKGGISGW